MKKISILLMVLVFSILAACSRSSTDIPTWQEQYDLGVRYLSEGNYEEAIIAFTAAIEIDPKRAEAYIERGNAYIGSGETAQTLAAALADYEAVLSIDAANAEAYLGLADVYIRMGEYDKAEDVLREGLEKTSGDKSIADKLAMIESGSITDSSGNVRRETTYREDGSLDSIFEYEYNEQGYESGWTVLCYEEGSLKESYYAVVELGEDGYPAKNMYYDQDGTPSGTYDLMTFNELGQEVERIKYYSDDSYTRYLYYYNDSGQRTRHEAYRDGELTSYWEYQYAEDGSPLGQTRYDAEGNVIGTTRYN